MTVTPIAPMSRATLKSALIGAFRARLINERITITFFAYTHFRPKPNQNGARLLWKIQSFRIVTVPNCARGRPNTFAIKIVVFVMDRTLQSVHWGISALNRVSIR